MVATFRIRLTSIWIKREMGVLARSVRYRWVGLTAVLVQVGQVAVSDKSSRHDAVLGKLSDHRQTLTTKPICNKQRKTQTSHSCMCKCWTGHTSSPAHSLCSANLGGSGSRLCVVPSLVRLLVFVWDSGVLGRKHDGCRELRASCVQSRQNRTCMNHHSA